MSDHIDLIEVLRHLDPVPPGSIDEPQCATAAELRMMLGDDAAIVRTTPFDDHRVHAGGLRWWRFATVIAVTASVMAALLLVDGDGQAPARMTDPVTSVSQPTPPTLGDSGPRTLGEPSFTMTSPSADEEAQATDLDLYRANLGLTQVSASGNYVTLRRCRDVAFATCAGGWAYVTGVAGGGEMHGGVLGEPGSVDLRLSPLDHRYFVASESAPGEEAPARAWLIDAVSGQNAVLSWRNDPTTFGNPEQRLLLCPESYNSFATECALTSVWDDTPFVAEVGESSAGGTTVTDTAVLEGQFMPVPTEAGLPKVVDIGDGTIRPLAMPDDAVAALPVAQRATGRIWIGTDPDGPGLGLAYSDDGGATWFQVALPGELGATDDDLAGMVHDDLLEIAADGDRVAVASSWRDDDNTVYVTDDAGTTWTAASSQPGGNGVHLYVLADGRLVVMGSMDTTPSDLLVSRPLNWALLDNVDAADLEPMVSHRFSVNGAGVALILSVVLACEDQGEVDGQGRTFIPASCPGYTEEESEVSVADTVVFSTDLMNWSTINIARP